MRSFGTTSNPAWLGGWVWKKVVLLLEERGNRVYAVTPTGMGREGPPRSKDVGIETAIQDVLNVIDAAGDTDPHAVFDLKDGSLSSCRCSGLSWIEWCRGRESHGRSLRSRAF